MSLIDQNNFAISATNAGTVLSSIAPYYGSLVPPVDATVQLSCLVEEGGSDPTNFLGG